jgi:hypothetical protein
MPPEHGTGGTSAVHAPHPDRLLVWCLLTCGCFRWFTPTPCFDVQGNIDAWFEQRRDLRQDWREAK